MERLGEVLWAVFSWALFLSTTGWVGYHWLRRSEEEPATILAKAGASAVVVVFLIKQIVPMAGRMEAGGPFLAVPLMAACGVVLAALWTPNILEMLARPFTAFYDGGGRELEPRPLYSRARALVYRGRIQDAVTEIRGQLERFPTDYEGQVFLAELQAGHLNDLPGAQLTIGRLVEQPGHAPPQVAAAWTMLAEWHLKYHQDTAAARGEFEKIVARFPGTPQAQLAEQRLAALPTTAMVLEAHDRREVKVEDHAVAYEMGRPRVKEVTQDSPEEAERKLLDRLERYPGDSVTREQLVRLYADEFGRLDYAVRQLEIMIAAPNQQQRDVVGWLERMADLQQQFGADKATVRRTLMRIRERFPKSSAAERAQNRMFRMGE